MPFHTRPSLGRFDEIALTTDTTALAPPHAASGLGAGAAGAGAATVGARRLELFVGPSVTRAMATPLSLISPSIAVTGAGSNSGKGHRLGGDGDESTPGGLGVSVPAVVALLGGDSARPRLDANEREAQERLSAAAAAYSAAVHAAGGSGKMGAATLAELRKLPAAAVPVPGADYPVRGVVAAVSLRSETGVGASAGASASAAVSVGAAHRSKTVVNSSGFKLNVISEDADAEDGSSSGIYGNSVSSVTVSVSGTGAPANASASAGAGACGDFEVDDVLPEIVLHSTEVPRLLAHSNPGGGGSLPTSSIPPPPGAPSGLGHGHVLGNGPEAHRPTSSIPPPPGGPPTSGIHTSSIPPPPGGPPVPGAPALAFGAGEGAGEDEDGGSSSTAVRQVHLFDPAEEVADPDATLAPNSTANRAFLRPQYMPSTVAEPAMETSIAEEAYARFSRDALSGYHRFLGRQTRPASDLCATNAGAANAGDTAAVATASAHAPAPAIAATATSTVVADDFERWVAGESVMTLHKHFEAARTARAGGLALAQATGAAWVERFDAKSTTANVWYVCCVSFGALVSIVFMVLTFLVLIIIAGHEGLRVTPAFTFPLAVIVLWVVISFVASCMRRSWCPSEPGAQARDPSLAPFRDPSRLCSIDGDTLFDRTWNLIARQPSQSRVVLVGIPLSLIFLATFIFIKSCGVGLSLWWFFIPIYVIALLHVFAMCTYAIYEDNANLEHRLHTVTDYDAPRAEEPMRGPAGGSMFFMIQVYLFCILLHLQLSGFDIPTMGLFAPFFLTALVVVIGYCVACCKCSDDCGSSTLACFTMLLIPYQIIFLALWTNKALHPDTTLWAPSLVVAVIPLFMAMLSLLIVGPIALGNYAMCPRRCCPSCDICFMGPDFPSARPLRLRMRVAAEEEAYRGQNSAAQGFFAASLAADDHTVTPMQLLS